MNGFNATAGLALACGIAVSCVTVSSKASTYNILYSFTGGADGDNPSTLIEVGGIL